MTGARSVTPEESSLVAACRSDDDEACLPKAVGHDMSFEVGSLFLDRPELASFHGLAGQCFSGVDGTAES
jgi:hypothetical protein